MKYYHAKKVCQFCKAVTGIKEGFTLPNMETATICRDCIDNHPACEPLRVSRIRKGRHNDDIR